MTSASEQLRFKISLGFPALLRSSEQIWNHPDLRILYPSYLVTMHGIVRSAAPLLESARDRCEQLADGDPVARALVSYLAKHSQEERGHDQWIIEDLHALGADPDLATSQVPSAKIAELVGAQYYWLRHVHPVSLLGHMAVVEGHAPQANFAARLRELTGYPPDGFRTIERHARIDVNHAQELYDTIDSLPLDARHQKIMGLSALHTVAAASAVFDEILANHASKSPVVAT
jgi:hypothetical protein